MLLWPDVNACTDVSVAVFYTKLFPAMSYKYKADTGKKSLNNFAFTCSLSNMEICSRLKFKFTIEINTHTKKYYININYLVLFLSVIEISETYIEFTNYI